jgi:hypothetical protein
VTEETREIWHVRHVSGSNVHVQEFDIRVDWDGRPIEPVFNRSNFAIDGATVHVSPRHAALIGAAPELLALARRYASECRHCDGRGVRMTHPAGATDDCFACADIRKIIAKAGG